MFTLIVLFLSSTLAFGGDFCDLGVVDELNKIVQTRAYPDSFGSQAIQELSDRASCKDLFKLQADIVGMGGDVNQMTRELPDLQTRLSHATRIMTDQDLKALAQKLFDGEISSRKYLRGLNGTENVTTVDQVISNFKSGPEMSSHLRQMILNRPVESVTRGLNQTRPDFYDSQQEYIDDMADMVRTFRLDFVTQGVLKEIRVRILNQQL